MKKIFILLTLFISIVSLSITSNAEAKNVKLKIDNKDITFTKQTGTPFIENDEIYVPIKKTFEGIGASISYDKNTKTTIITRKETLLRPYVKMQIVNNGSSIEIEYSNKNKLNYKDPNTNKKYTIIKNSISYIPIKYFDDFGYSFMYNQKNNTVTLLEDQSIITDKNKLKFLNDTIASLDIEQKNVDKLTLDKDIMYNYVEGVDPNKNQFLYTTNKYLNKNSYILILKDNNIVGMLLSSPQKDRFFTLPSTNERNEIVNIHFYKTTDEELSANVSNKEYLFNGDIRQMSGLIILVPEKETYTAIMTPIN